MTELTLKDKVAVVAARNAYEGLNDNQKKLVDSEVLALLEAAELRIVELETDQAAANEVINAIHALPSVADLRLEDKGAVEAARNAYKNLTDAQKSLVGDEILSKLEALESKLAELEIDHAAANEVINAIHALPSVADLRLEDKGAVEEARNAYANLTDAQKSLVSGEILAKLEALESKLIDLEIEQAAEEEANSFRTTYAEILELTLDTVSIADKDTVNTALIAYAKSSEIAKVKLTAEKTLLDNLLLKIEELEQEAADQAAANEVINAIHALPSVVDLRLEDKGAVEAARNGYKNLTDTQKSLVDDKILAKLEALESKLIDLEIEQAAEEEAKCFRTTYAAVLDLTLETVSIVNKETVNAALTAYAKSSEIAKVKLTAEKTLLDNLLLKIEKLEQEAADQAAANEVINAIYALPSVSDLRLEDKGAVEAARNAYKNLTDAQKSLVSGEILSKLEALESKLAELETDQAAANEVINAIHALPSVADLRLEDKGAVEAARNTYTNLTDAQKSLVSGEILAKLEALESKLIDLEIEQAAEEEAKCFRTTYAAVLDLTLETVSIVNKETVNAALTAYAKSSEIAKVKLTAEKTLLDNLLLKIGELEQEAADQAAANEVINAIHALPLVSDLRLEDKGAVEEARNAYTNLTDTQKNLVSGEILAKLEALESKLVELEIEQAAEIEANSFRTTYAEILELTLDTVSIADKDTVNTALIAYAKSSEIAKVKLTAEKTLLSNLLLKIEELEQEAADQAAANEVINAIHALPLVSDLRLEDKGEVEAARNVYKNLTDAQKSLVSGEILSKLEALESKLVELETDHAAANEVINAIHALPSVADLGLEDKGAVEAARNAYKNLTDAQKNLVSDEILSKLEALESKLVELEIEQAAEKEANSFRTTYAEILELTLDTVSIADKDTVNTALIAYAKSSEIAKVKLTAEKTLLDNLLLKIGELEQEAADQAAANEVINAIYALPSVSDLRLEDKGAVEEARNAYTNLTDTQKNLVSGEILAKLEALESKLAELETDQAAANEVINAIHALPSVADLRLEDKGAVEAARNAYTNLTDAQKSLVSGEILAKLEALESKLIDLEIEQAAEEEAKCFRTTYAEILELTLDTVSIADKDPVNTALIAYAKVSKIAKGKLTDEKTLLDNLLSKIEELEKAVSTVEDSIASLPGVNDLTLKDKEKVIAVRAAFDNLNDREKAFVNNISKLEAIEEKLAILEITVNQIGDEMIDGFYIVNRDYTNNSIISDDIGPVTLKIGDKDVTEHFDFTFFEFEGGNKITTFDLSEGATTFRVYMHATSKEYNDVSSYVVFKYRSVTIGNGNSEEYFTIEDALDKAETGTIYVKYNTSFANADVAELVYGGTSSTIKKGVTLLLPYSSDLSSNTNDTPKGTGGALSRDNAYVELTLPTGIDLNVEGTLTINAMRANISTKFSGHVTGSNYAQLHLKEDSNITVRGGGTLNTIGFVYGDGTIEALSGSKVFETMFIKSFRGGTATFRVSSEVFPFDQYTINNNEVDLIIHSGASYVGKALIYASSSYTSGDVKIVGNQNSYLLELIEGIIIKSYDLRSGRVSFEIQGNANINNTSVNAGGITASSSGKDLPFDGTWSITVAAGSNLTITSWVMLLPGARVSIEPNAKVTVAENGKITVFDPYEHLDDYNSYPANASAYYRIKPEFDFNSETPATLNVDGTLIVKGGLAGRVRTGKTGKIEFVDKPSTTYNVKYVSGSAGDAKANSREVSLWREGESTIAVVANSSAAKFKDVITVTATVKDGTGNPLKGVEVLFSGGNGSWSHQSVITDARGKAVANYTVSDKESDPTILNATENHSNKTASATIEIGSSGCPFVYSFDGEEYHFEHEPVPYSINKAFEATTYGTLHKLVETDGRYHIKITEELETETFVNGFNLYAIDYKEDNEVKEIIADIFGNPHTIKERIQPKSFVDSMGRNYLEEVTTKGLLVRSPESMYDEGQYVVSYESVFNRPTDSGDAAKLLISAKVTSYVDSFGIWFKELIDGENNIWWIQEVLLSMDSKEFIDAIDMISLEVDLWDGSNWINQGKVSGGSHLLEEFLIPLDLSSIQGERDQIKVRLRSGSGFFEIDQVSIDYSEDDVVVIQKLDVDKAFLNGLEDVSQTISEFHDNHRVKLQKGDYIDLYYNAPELREGYRRGFMVEFKGYFTSGLESKESPIEYNWSSMTFEEIISLVLAEQPDAIETVNVLEWLFELAESVYEQPMEYKVEKVFVENVLPWLIENKGE